MATVSIFFLLKSVTRAKTDSWSIFAACYRVFSVPPFCILQKTLERRLNSVIVMFSLKNCVHFIELCVKSDPYDHDFVSV